MADSYIDQHEAVIYGKFAREQLLAVCLGKVPELDGAVRFAVAQQEKADAALKAVLDQQPVAASARETAQVQAEINGIVVRFGGYTTSLEGSPVDVNALLLGDSPSLLAKRRTTKLVGALEHAVTEFKKVHATLRDGAYWQGKLEEALAKATALGHKQRSNRSAQADSPSVAAAREAWLGVYNNNKNLIRGLLGHAGRPELLAHVFDDLAEHHRAVGVTDTAAPEVVSTPTPAPVAPEKHG
jgi:hypothetical protein